MEAKSLDGNESQQHIIVRQYHPTRRSSSTSTSSEASAHHFQVDQRRSCACDIPFAIFRLTKRKPSILQKLKFVPLPDYSPRRRSRIKYVGDAKVQRTTQQQDHLTSFGGV